MKFHWFAQETYPHLGADFYQRYPTAVVAPPPSIADPLKVGQMYRMFLDLMEYADEVGFDGLAVNEHHQNAGAMTPSPNLLAATLAKNTRNAALLIIGDSIALYNPPTRVAEEMAYIDCLSEGRLIAGFVLGTPMDSVYAYGVPPAELRPRFAEARDLILKSWQAEEPFAFNGKYTKLRYVNPWPRPVQKPTPPIWIPGSGSIETWDLVIDNNYCYGHLSFAGLNSARPIVNEFWQHVSQRGGDMNPHRLAFTQIVCVSETDAQAEKDYYDAVKSFYLNTNRVSRGFTMAPGYRSKRSQTWELERARSNPDRDRAYRGELSFDEYNEKGFIIAGSPQTVRQRIRELVTELRVGQLIATPHMGDLRAEVVRKNTYLFAKEVIPYLRDLWADEPDHWTPKVSQERVAARATGVPSLVAGS